MPHPARACFAAIVACAVLGGGAAAPVAKAPAKPVAAKPAAKPAAGAASTGPVTPPAIYYVVRRTEEAWTVMDPAAVEAVPGGSVKRSYSVTVRRNLLNGGPPQPGYVRTLNEYDCQTHKFRWRTFTIYNRFGAVVVKQDNAQTDFLALDRGSEEETTFRVICEGGGGGSVVAAPSLAQLVIGLMQAWDDAAMTTSLQAIAPDAAGKADPKKGAPKTVDGKKPDAKAPDPKTPEAKTPDPKTSDSKSPTPKTP